jgi:hypothetical protein
VELVHLFRRAAETGLSGRILATDVDPLARRCRGRRTFPDPRVEAAFVPALADLPERSLVSSLMDRHPGAGGAERRIRRSRARLAVVRRKQPADARQVDVPNGWAHERGSADLAPGPAAGRSIPLFVKPHGSAKSPFVSRTPRNWLSTAGVDEPVINPSSPARVTGISWSRRRVWSVVSDVIEVRWGEVTKV